MVGRKAVVATLVRPLTGSMDCRQSRQDSGSHPPNVAEYLPRLSCGRAVELSFEGQMRFGGLGICSYLFDAPN